MGTVTGATAQKVQEIEAASIVGAEFVDNELVLTRGDETQIVVASTVDLFEAVISSAIQAAIDDFNEAQTTIDALPDADPITGTEEFPIFQGGETKRLNALELFADFPGPITINLGSAGVLRLQNVAGELSFALYENATDAQPKLAISQPLSGLGAIAFGAGGATPVDVFVIRTAAGLLKILGSGLTTGTALLEAALSLPIAATAVDRSFNIADLTRVVEVSHATIVRTQTIVPVATTAYPVNGFLRVRKSGAANVLLAATPPATILDPHGLTMTISTQHETRKLHHHATNEWIMERGF